MNAYLTPGELGQLCGAGRGTGRRGRGPLRRRPALGASRARCWSGTDLLGAGGRRLPAPAPDRRSGDEDDTALILFTSGTTGLPKPIAISHGVVADRLAYYAKPIDPDGRPQVVDMMSAPIFHIAGTLGPLHLPHQGKQMVMLPRFDAGEWLARWRLGG